MNGREAYEEKVENELEQADRLIQDWLDRVERVDEEVEPEQREQVKAEYCAKIEAVQDIRSRARARLQALKEADDAGWADLQPGMEGVLSELRRAALNTGATIWE